MRHPQSTQIRLLRCSLIRLYVCSDARCNSVGRAQGGPLLCMLISAPIEPVQLGVDGETDVQENIVSF
ncbi:hypothetical protein P692DRAFT_201798470 [Suillus brevipes Sb2]|nr:hypothetical protein P692DRAFT_201798470 [Suillus brevipes Sb2]